MRITRQVIWISLFLVGMSAMLMVAAPQVSPQRTFASPEEAMKAMIDAAEHNDSAALLQLFGPGSQDIVQTGSPAEEKDHRAHFAELGHEKVQVVLDPARPNHANFLIGNQDWPFPVPLVRRDGKWMFDTAKGRVEILAHRIGRNELDTVDSMRGYVEAQLDYSNKDHTGDGFLKYAQQLFSTPGKQDGLYWEGPGSLIPKAMAEAAVSYPASAVKETPYHGYYFHVLKAQGSDAAGGEFNYVVKGEMIGGFALVAWPAQYEVTGVKTFIVNHIGVVYQKDLGPTTVSLARAMPKFNPDKTWRKVDLE